MALGCVARSLVLALSLHSLAACAPTSVPDASQPGRANELDRTAIGGVLDDWHDAAAKADEARYFGHLADDSVFLGTDASERWDKAAFVTYAHPHFAKGKAWSFRATRRAIVLDRETIAHFDEDLETQGLGPARGSGVLEKRAGRWIIVHYNLTITVPNDRFDAVKDTLAAVALSSKGDALEDVAFLAGAWVGRDADGGEREEHWTHAAGGTLIGSGRATRAGKTTFFEHLRIERRDDGSVVYVAQPLGKPATEFKRVSSAHGDASFENATHDWPKKIHYRRSGDSLVVRVEGALGEPVEELSFNRASVTRER